MLIFRGVIWTNLVAKMVVRNDRDRKLGDWKPCLGDEFQPTDRD